jgi:hypothetical protein
MGGCVGGAGGLNQQVDQTASEVLSKEGMGNGMKQRDTIGRIGFCNDVLEKEARSWSCWMDGDGREVLTIPSTWLLSKLTNEGVQRFGTY